MTTAIATVFTKTAPGTVQLVGKDTEEGLGEILVASFDRVELETVGSIAIFSATNPRTDTSH